MSLRFSSTSWAVGWLADLPCLSVLFYSSFLSLSLSSASGNIYEPTKLCLPPQPGITGRLWRGDGGGGVLCLLYILLGYFSLRLSHNLTNLPTNLPTGPGTDGRGTLPSSCSSLLGPGLMTEPFMTTLTTTFSGRGRFFYFTRRWENTLRGAGLMRRGTSTKFGTGLYVQVTVFWMCTTCFRRGLVTNKPVFDGAGASCGGAFFPWDKERALALLGLQTDRLVFGDGECCWCGCLGTRGGLLLWFLLYMYRTYLPNSGGENSCQ